MRCLETRETFHPGIGPSAEARILHIEQQQLAQRCTETLARGENFVIWDVGFGAAANALAAIESLETHFGEKHLGQNSGQNLEPASEAQIELHSFDQVTGPIEFALAHAQELEYLLPHQSTLRQLLKDRWVKFPFGLVWKLHLGDFRDQLRSKNRLSPLPSPHAIFYDPYSPAKNPEMWNLEHFRLLYQNIRAEVPCLLSTYTRSTSVRVSLLLAGFSVGNGCIIGEKAETTLASNQLDLLKKPLNHHWLERVRSSTNGAPLRSPQYTQARILPEDFKLLEQCLQFQPNSEV